MTARRERERERKARERERKARERERKAREEERGAGRGKRGRGENTLPGGHGVGEIEKFPRGRSSIRPVRCWRCALEKLRGVPKGGHNLRHRRPMPHFYMEREGQTTKPEKRCLLLKLLAEQSLIAQKLPFNKKREVACKLILWRLLAAITPIPLHPPPTLPLMLKFFNGLTGFFVL